MQVKNMGKEPVATRSGLEIKPGEVVTIEDETELHALKRCGCVEYTAPPKPKTTKREVRSED